MIHHPTFAETVLTEYQQDNVHRTFEKVVLNPSFVIGHHVRNHNSTTRINARKILEVNKTKSQRFKGYLSDNARKRCKKAASMLLVIARNQKVHNPSIKRSQPFLASFLTFTFPCDLTSKQESEVQKKFVEPMLQWLQKSKGTKLYLWRLERTKRGRLHLHVICDSFVIWWDLRNRWNKQLRQNGMLDKYFKEYNTYNANSTDIRAVKSVKSVNKYISKYMAKKSDDSLPIMGRVWDCSMILKSEKWPSTYISPAIWEQVFAQSDGSGIAFVSDWNFALWDWDAFKCVPKWLNEMRALFRDWMMNVRLNVFGGPCGAV